MKYIRPICYIVLFFVISINYPARAKIYPYVGIIAKNNVNLRSGYNKNFISLKRLKIGDKFVVLDKYYHWYKVKLPTNITCFVSKKFVTSYGIVRVNNLNVRAKAGLRYDIVGQLKKGEKVNISGISDGWYKIKAPPSCAGWIYEKYLDYYSDYKNFQKEINLKQQEIKRFRKFANVNLNNLDKYSLDKLNEILNDTKNFINDFPNSEYIEVVKNTAKKIKLVVSSKQTVQAVKQEKRVNTFPFKATGFIKELGNIIGNPAKHQLVVKGQTKYYLTSDKINLYNYLGYPVSIWGYINNTNYKYPLVTVEKIKQKY